MKQSKSNTKKKDKDSNSSKDSSNDFEVISNDQVANANNVSTSVYSPVLRFFGSYTCIYIYSCP